MHEYAEPGIASFIFFILIESTNIFGIESQCI
jgi:hypothetical protein